MNLLEWHVLSAHVPFYIITLTLSSPVCSARLFRPPWITSYGVTRAARWPLIWVTFPCWPGCWCRCPCCWWWWSTKWWSFTRYGKKSSVTDEQWWKGGILQISWTIKSVTWTHGRFLSNKQQKEKKIVFLSWSWSLIWTLLSTPGCEFATRRGRSCSLKQSWGWTLHSDAFPMRTLVSQQYWETREGQDANTVEPSVNPSAQEHCSNQVEQISTKCQGGGFMPHILKLLVCFLKPADIVMVIWRAGTGKIPKHSFPFNRKEPKIGNYLLSGFSFKGMRNVFWRGLCFLTFTSVLHLWEICMHGHSCFREWSRSQTIHQKLLHVQRRFLWSLF